MAIARHLNPKRYYKSVLRGYYRRRYAKAAMIDAEIKKFAQWDFNLEAAQARLNQLLETQSQPPYDPESMSIHWVLFSCLSLKERPRRILDLGTFSGEFTVILSRLFPDSSITTVDLPKNDPIVRSTYSRSNEERYHQHLHERAKNLDRPNISVIERNSFFLLEVVEGPFDMIWVDAGHRFPEVAWDICNAYHLCRPGGFILCDDVIPHPKGYGATGLVNSDSHEVLAYLDERLDCQSTYFLKRWGAAYSANPRIRKYVSLTRKKSGPAVTEVG